MKVLRVETMQYGWINRFALLKNEEGYVLKIRQYKLGKENQKFYREIHIWGNESVEKLREFLINEVRK